MIYIVEEENADIDVHDQLIHEFMDWTDLRWILAKCAAATVADRICEFEPNFNWPVYTMFEIGNCLFQHAVINQIPFDFNFFGDEVKPSMAG